MKSALSFLLSGIMALLGSCSRSGEPDNTLQDRSTPQWRRNGGLPPSTAYFADTEQKLAGGSYTFAAGQLNKAIVAYRSETGKMDGNAARRANRAIDELVRLQRRLRAGKSVDAYELRLAIQSALDVEGAVMPPPPGHDNDGGMGVPVNGH